MPNNAQLHATPYQQTATGTTSAVATQAAVTGQTFYVTDISGSSDKAAAKILVKDGATVIWQDQIQVSAAGASYYEHTFGTPLKCTSGNSASVTVDGTSVSNANLAGFVVNNT